MLTDTSLPSLAPHEAHWAAIIRRRLAVAERQHRYWIVSRHPGARHHVADLLMQIRHLEQQLEAMGAPS